MTDDSKSIDRHWLLLAVAKAKIEAGETLTPQLQKAVNLAFATAFGTGALSLPPPAPVPKKLGAPRKGRKQREENHRAMQLLISGGMKPVTAAKQIDRQRDLTRTADEKKVHGYRTVLRDWEAQQQALHGFWEVGGAVLVGLGRELKSSELERRGEYFLARAKDIGASSTAPEKIDKKQR